MTDDKNITGTSDPIYNLVSALYHCLEGTKTYDKYLADAVGAGDQELIQYFKAARQEERQRAMTARRLLAGRLKDED